MFGPGEQDNDHQRDAKCAMVKAIEDRFMVKYMEFKSTIRVHNPAVLQAGQLLAQEG